MCSYLDWEFAGEGPTLGSSKTAVCADCAKDKKIWPITSSAAPLNQTPSLSEQPQISHLPSSTQPKPSRNLDDVDAPLPPSPQPEPQAIMRLVSKSAILQLPYVHQSPPASSRTPQTAPLLRLLPACDWAKLSCEHLSIPKPLSPLTLHKERSGASLDLVPAWSLLRPRAHGSYVR